MSFIEIKSDLLLCCSVAREKENAQTTPAFMDVMLLTPARQSDAERMIVRARPDRAPFAHTFSTGKAQVGKETVCLVGPDYC